MRHHYRTASRKRGKRRFDPRQQPLPSMRRYLDDWRSISNPEEKWHAYLKSREWSNKRQEVYHRCGGTCEYCGSYPMRDVHHVTYARRFRELLTDLLGVCRRCHERLHGK